MMEVIPIEEVEAQAMALATAIINSKDIEIEHHYRIQGVDWAWEAACSIVESGPQDDMEQRIVAEAMVRRLGGKR